LIIEVKSSLTFDSYGNGGIYAFYAMDENGEYANNCWDEMPLICEITWNQKKIFCSHGAMPLNKKGEWEKSETGMLNRKYFLANWNENIFTEDPKQEIEKSNRGSGYKMPIKKIFDNMVNKGYDWSIHGHVHQNQCGILKNKNKRVVTIVAHEGGYDNKEDTPFLPAVYIINNENPNGIFFYLLQTKNDKIKDFYKENPTNRDVQNNCVIYTYNIIEGKKIGHNILKKIYCCSDICEK
jgi:hypothetical protein